MRTLVVPPAAQRDEDAIQMVSAWIAEKGLHCTINIGMWRANGRDEARAWGILLADVARHIGNALHEETGVDPTSAVNALIRSLLDEIGDPTAAARGSFNPGPN